MDGAISRSSRVFLPGGRLLVALAVLIIGSAGLLAPVQAEPQETTEGSLEWGLKESFRGYIVGPIAHGHVNVSDGATQAADNGVFTFPMTNGFYDPDAGQAAGAFAGTLHFQGHEGFGVPAGEYALDLKITNVNVLINGPVGFIVADVESRGLEDGEIASYPEVFLAQLNLAGITPTVDGDNVTFANVPASLTAAGVPAFADFYAEGTALDPITFSLVLGDTGGDPEPEPDEATQTITTEVLATGGLSISVAGATVALPDPVLNTEGDALVSSGAINAVTVTDLRSEDPGWNVSGHVSDFTSATDSFSGEFLGWTPEVVSTSDGQVVTAGDPVAPGTGLSSPADLGSAAAGEGRGTAELGATLELELPTDTPPGEYSATLTLTVI